MQESWSTQSPEETQALASKILSQHADIQLWLLEGDLAAGKTCFMKGVAKHHKDESHLQSPTFAVLTEYRDFQHYDLYRLEEPDYLLEEQIDEDLSSSKKVFIEWPERLTQEPMKPYAKLTFKHSGDQKREITLQVLQ